MSSGENPNAFGYSSTSQSAWPSYWIVSLWIMSPEAALPRTSLSAQGPTPPPSLLLDAMTSGRSEGSQAPGVRPHHSKLSPVLYRHVQTWVEETELGNL